LADQRKPLVKFSLIILNAGGAGIKAAEAPTTIKISAPKNPLFGSIAAAIRPRDVTPQASERLLDPVGKSLFARFGGRPALAGGPRLGRR
jgi:hypothetical protein